MLSESAVRDLSEKSHEPKWMLERRITALKEFNKMPMPSLRYGIGIFVDISGLDLGSIEPKQASDDWVVVAPDNVEVLEFSQAWKKYEGLMKEWFMTKCAKPGEDKFAALHAAFFNSGMLIRIPKGVVVDSPIRVNVEVKAQTRIESILVLAEEGSSATVIDYAGSGRSKFSSFRSQIVEVVVLNDAHVEYITVQDVSLLAFNFSKRRGYVGDAASISWMECHTGGFFTQADTVTSLRGNGAESFSHGVVFGSGNQCFDIKNETDHQAEKSVSDMLTKSVLSENSKVVYRGMVKIGKGKAGCRGYQKSDNILLSDTARVSVIPNLEIENDEVKCSHGATISAVDPDMLFYMMSRGISDRESKKAIVEGFFEPVLVRLRDENLKSEILSRIAERMGV